MDIHAKKRSEAREDMLERKYNRDVKSGILLKGCMQGGRRCSDDQAEVAFVHKGSGAEELQILRQEGPDTSV